MFTQVHPNEDKIIHERIPEDIQAFCSDHELILGMMAHVWNIEELAEGYDSNRIDVYVEEQDEPIISYVNGEIEVACPDFVPENFTALVVEVDFVLRYVQIRGREIFNKLGALRLPVDFKIRSDDF
jgi:hypothetical protein